ncbi:MAG: hypothetical protein UU12_C0041G0010 [Candidatus Woesebacteria bacterium GW2011_GWA2_40_7b]|uniref:Uncharacterized protein n=1 Tax=Candidatus Woesebacteria bacterium GW2011_GWA2_40_7b TaxID=1618563 RepID=A0A0G0SXX0_9BACT|nr:MAG: hypothetical protein UU12_C0041G0010 [Candidatus Woesebacteria bacterium GW2011_GWA2_40_7b]
MKQKGFAPILILLIIIVVGAIYLILFKNVKENILSLPVLTLQNSDSTKNNKSRIVYGIGEWDSGHHFLLRNIWIADTAGKNAIKLISPGIPIKLINNVTDGWIYYKDAQYNTVDGSTNIYAYNYLTKESKKIIENNNESGNIIITNHSVSPDNKKIFYFVEYIDPQNRIGLINVDLYPKYKTGAYVYNIETDKKVYLGNFSDINMWNKNSEFVYTTFGKNYHNYKLQGGLYKINITNGQTSPINTSPPGGYFVFDINPLENDDLTFTLKYAKPEGDSVTQYDYNLIVTKGTIKKVILNTKNFTVENIKLSPDNLHAIYTSNNGNGPFSEIRLLDLMTLDDKTILKADVEDNLYKPSWVTNSSFVVEYSKKIGSGSGWKASVMLMNILSGKTQVVTDTDHHSL